MGAELIQVDDSQVVIALGRFQLSLQQNEELMSQIGAAQLLSVRRTFRGHGSPSGSWVPLAASTIRSNPKIYGPGHKLLVRSGRLLNSIAFQAEPGSVTVGTNLRYAAVHQYGSRDRGTATGPRTEAESKSVVDVQAHSYSRLSGELGVGKLKGRKRRIQGPRNASRVNVGAHQRHQNIPARPYLVFRAEDPARIRGLVSRYIAQAKEQAGLGGAQ
jgi:phage gpG-like protein